MDEPEEVEEMVSDIYSVKGSRNGTFVEDQFDLIASDLVQALIGPFNSAGHGALVFREQAKTAVMLVPPLTFTFKTRREQGTSWPTELVVTGHFMCLVHREGKQPRWAFDDERALYGNKLAYKKAVAAAVQELDPGVVPSQLVSFLSLLLEPDSSDDEE
jgi:hypothetical protein